MNKAYVRPATLEDAVQLSSNLREADLRELKSSLGISPTPALITGVIVSHRPFSIITPDGETVLGIFGVVEGNRCNHLRTGCIWMMASDKILHHSRQFLRESRKWVDSLQEDYDILHNLVDERNKVHMRWLDWCGFTFLQTRPYGAEQKPFVEFIRTKNKRN